MATSKPLQVNVADRDIQDLKRRLSHTRWPEPEVVDDWSQGVPLTYLQALASEWGSSYDWRKCEDWINAQGLQTLAIGTQDIAFLHIRSDHPDAKPLLLSHGWPGSILEFKQLIPRLSEGTEGEQTFHLVIPCLPGFGFSGKPTQAGTGVATIAYLFDQLMKSLGYQQYYAHGGDWGSIITQTLPLIPGTGVLGIHITMPVVQPDPATMNELTAEENEALAAGAHYVRWDSGYSTQQASRPQTIGYALTDSPVGQLAWIVEKFWSWTDCDRDGVSLPEHAVDRTTLLDTVSLYWFTATAASSARLYWESFHPTEELPIVNAPTGVSLFPKEIFKASRRWVEKRFPNLRYWNSLSAGGHFAALEQPDTLAQEIRTCIASFD